MVFLSIIILKCSVNSLWYSFEKITTGNSLILLNIKKKHLGIFDKYSDVVEELAVYAPGEWIVAYKSGQEIL